MSARGLDHDIQVVELAETRRVVVRRWSHLKQLERAAFLEARGGFLERHGVPGPRLLAASIQSGLYEFATGTLFGDLIETGCASDKTWQLVRGAFRRLHVVQFPAGMAGNVGPDGIVLRPVDPVAQMHTRLDEAVEGLRRRAPNAIDHVSALHALVDRTAAPLRSAPTVLGHGDNHVWNVIVEP